MDPVAVDAVGRQPVANPGLEPGRSRIVELPDEVLDQRQLLKRRDLGVRIRKREPVDPGLAQTCISVDAEAEANSSNSAALATPRGG